jgi:hypothetical protein
LDSPDELRRKALGGDVIEIKTAQAFDAVQLESLPGIRQVRQNAPRQFLVIADEAGTTMPRVVQEVHSLGGEVVSSTEYRPSFDEVFTAIVASDDGDSADHEWEDSRARDSRAVRRAA